MKDFFLWFYCLPIWEAILIILLATVVFVYLRQRFAGRIWWNAAEAGLLAVWLLAMVWATLVDRSVDPSGRRTVLVPMVSYLKLLQGGNPEILRVNLMNVILFYPAGLLMAALLPERWRMHRRLLLIMTVCCCVSIWVELMQYWFGAGLAEADDVIHNTLGGAVGTVASRLPVKQSIRNL